MWRERGGTQEQRREPEKTMQNTEPKQVKGEKNEDDYDYYYNSMTITISIIVFND